MSKKMINSKALLALLERVHLGGMLDECLLRVDSQGLGTVTAVDLSNSVMLSVQEPSIGLSAGNYGITNLTTLVKFLKACVGEELRCRIEKERWLSLYRRGHGKFSFLLLEEDSGPISTQLSEDPDFEQLAKGYDCSAHLKKQFAEDANQYLSMAGEQGVSFTASEQKGVHLHSAGTGGFRFTIPVQPQIDVNGEVSVKVYSNQLQAVIGQLHFEEEEPVLVHLKEEFPIIIQQDSDNFWALTPVVT
jgi:hypothetical protein